MEPAKCARQRISPYIFVKVLLAVLGNQMELSKCIFFVTPLNGFQIYSRYSFMEMSKLPSLLSVCGRLSKQLSNKWSVCLPKEQFCASLTELLMNGRGYFLAFATLKNQNTCRVISFLVRQFQLLITEFR